MPVELRSPNRMRQRGCVALPPLALSLFSARVCSPASDSFDVVIYGATASGVLAAVASRARA